ncbi:hypothetical protein BV25DRAFT_1920571 [Artomyces pyxidatus]|uniref:Uncharacterized protein n=1 Tax=Artomyces pyxidatus TaxID=48021 RepID=A0ACB8SL29_9AGAM|nr:hypothetical protein BV25DRAFT_1920571 [Artomyces pyxidatus]
MQCNFNFLIALLLFMLAQTVAAMPTPTDALTDAPVPEATATLTDPAITATMPEPDFIFKGGGAAMLGACMIIFELSKAQFALNL